MRNRVDFFGPTNKVGFLVTSRYAIGDMPTSYLKALDLTGVKIIATHEDLSCDRLVLLITAPSLRELSAGDIIPEYCVFASRDGNGLFGARLEEELRGRRHKQPTSETSK